MSKGGKREGAGRKKGVPNKATSDLRELARQYTPSALRELARLANEAESETARVTAIKELFDRAYGKAPQSMEHSTKDGQPLFQPVINVTTTSGPESSSAS